MKKITLYLYACLLVLLAQVSTAQICPNATCSAGPDQTVCAGVNITLSGSVGTDITTYTWSAVGGGTFTPDANSLNATFTPSSTQLALGTATLTLTTDDPAGACLAASDQVVITFNPSVTVSAGVDQSICAGNNVTLAGTISGGATTGIWSGGLGTFSPSATSLLCVYTPSASEVTAGTVTLTLTSDDPAGPCPAVSDKVVVTIITPTVNAGADQVICAGASISLSGSAGAGISTVLWSGGAGVFSPNANTLNAVYMPTAAEVASGSVTLTLNSDTSICGTASDQMQITINVAASISASVDQTVCAGSAVSLSGSVSGSASSGTWSGGSGSFIPNVNTLNCFYLPSSAEISAGTVTLTLTSDDPAGPCPAVSDQLMVTINASVTVSASVDQNICEGAQVNLSGSVSGGISAGTWSGGSGAFSPDPTTLNCVYIPSASDIIAGSVTLTLTSDNPAGPCPAESDQMVINILPLPAVSISASGSTTLCAGATVDLTASAGSAYLWSTAAITQSITVNASGSYSVMVTDSNGCSASANINVTVHVGPSLNLGVDTSLCFGQTIALDAGNAGASFLWSTLDTSQTLLVSASGSFYVSVSDPNGCSASDTISITIATSPVTVNLGSDTTVYICTHAGYLLDAGISGAAYLWSTAEATQSIYASVSGSYHVSVDVGGCIGSDTISLTIIDNTIDLDLGADTTVCGCIQLNAYAPGASYSWCGGEQYSTINVCNSGVYCVEVNNGMCKAWDTISVMVATPVVNLGNDTVLVSGSLVLNAGNAGATFSWSTGATAQTITVTASGIYYVTVTNSFGCSISDTINISIISGVHERASAKYALSVFPNPSADGKFTLKFDMPEQGLVEIRLYNQLGAQLYFEKNEKFRGAYEKNILPGDLAPGLYFAEVLRNGTRSIAKVTVD